jgi:hypothetical protein
VLDYSRNSRHLLVTAGDDGSVHLWDTTAKSPKVSEFGVLLMLYLFFGCSSVIKLTAKIKIRCSLQDSLSYR